MRGVGHALADSESETGASNYPLDHGTVLWLTVFINGRWNGGGGEEVKVIDHPPPPAVACHDYIVSRLQCS